MIWFTHLQFFSGPISPEFHSNRAHVRDGGGEHRHARPGCRPAGPHLRAAPVHRHAVHTRALIAVHTRALMGLCENHNQLTLALALTPTRCRSFMQPRRPATRSNCASSCERTPKTLITEHPTVRHPCTKQQPRGTRDACTCCSQATRLSTSPTQAGRRHSCRPSTTATLSSWRCVPVLRAAASFSLPPPPPVFSSISLLQLPSNLP